MEEEGEVVELGGTDGERGSGEEVGEWWEPYTGRGKCCELLW